MSEDRQTRKVPGGMLPRYTMLATAAAVVISVIVGVIGSRGVSHPDIPADLMIVGADTSAWFLGSEHADAFINDNRGDEVRALRLLDVRARETNIRAHLGDDAARAYILGFEYTLRQRSDSLARRILKK